MSNSIRGGGESASHKSTAMRQHTPAQTTGSGIEILTEQTAKEINEKFRQIHAAGALDEQDVCRDARQDKLRRFTSWVGEQPEELDPSTIGPILQGPPTETKAMILALYMSRLNEIDGKPKPDTSRPSAEATG